MSFFYSKLSSSHEKLGAVCTNAYLSRYLLLSIVIFFFFLALNLNDNVKDSCRLKQIEDKKGSDFTGGF